MSAITPPDWRHLPRHDATSFIAVIGTIGMAVASIPALREAIEDPENLGVGQV